MSLFYADEDGLFEIRLHVEGSYAGLGKRIIWTKGERNSSIVATHYSHVAIHFIGAI